MIWGVAMVRDEADVIEPLIRHMLGQVDALIVADNMSSDGTRDILDVFDDERLLVVEDTEPAYYQAQKMTTLGRMAASRGATWVLPFDADEWWYATEGTIRDALSQEIPVDILKTWGHNHFPHPEDKPDDPNPFTRMQWRENDTQKLPKVAYRPHPASSLHMGNHDVDMPGRRNSGLLEFRHFGYRSFEQMMRKVRNGKQAYDLSDLHPMHGAHWRELGALSDEDLHAEWEQVCTQPGLIHDPAPMP